MPSASLGIIYRDVPEISLKVSGGVSVGSEDAKKWCPILPPDSPHIQGLAEFAVKEFNSKYGNNLVLKKVLSAWTWKVDESTTKYRLYLAAIDCVARLLKFEAVVVEKANGGLLTKTLESFVQIDS